MNVCCYLYHLSLLFLLSTVQCRNLNNVHEAWFADEEKVRKAVGLLVKPDIKSSKSKEVCRKEKNIKFWIIYLFRLFLVIRYATFLSLMYHLKLVCGICFDSYPHDMIRTVACGHPFCNTCWTGFPLLCDFIFLFIFQCILFNPDYFDSTYHGSLH